jgi:regulator of cell morphogenesis and NO signaling
MLWFERFSREFSSMIDISATTTVGDIVARDLRSATVFARHGIDFCCGGRRSLEEVCQAHGLDLASVTLELEDASAGSGDARDVTRWPLDRLVDHILTTHHAYVRARIPLIQGYMTNLLARHGGHPPEVVLARLAQVFEGLADELTHHMEKEERILFPYIRTLVEARTHGGHPAPTPFGTIQNPVRVMEEEHQHAGDEMWLIRRLTNHFQPPEEACATWRAFYAALADFERDLHEHVHLENTVLFPAAAQLEKELG